MTLALKIYATILIILFINAYFSHALLKNSDTYQKEERREVYYGFSCLILVLWLFFIGIACIWHLY